MVAKTSELLPEPETPVNTVSRRFGISMLMSLRLFTRAPCTRIRSWRSATSSAGDCVSVLVALLIVSPSVGRGRLRGFLGVAWLDRPASSSMSGSPSSARSRQRSAVYLIGGVDRGGATPVRLTLAGVALGVRTKASAPLRPVEPLGPPRGVPAEASDQPAAVAHQLAVGQLVHLAPGLDAARGDAEPAVRGGQRTRVEAGARGEPVNAVGVGDGGHQAAATDVVRGLLHGGTRGGHLGQLRLEVRHVPAGHR